MSAYHITGPSGSGKSHVGRELNSRGYKVIETDFEPGLSSWVDKETGEKITELPPQPYRQEWVDAHAWLWDALKMRRLIEEVADKPVFFVGGAHNEKDFFHLFDKRFGLFVDTPTIVSRLQPREPERWVDDSAELQQLMEWNERSKDYHHSNGALLVDSSLPVEIVADTILSYLKSQNK
jgi:shikimate kinase